MLRVPCRGDPGAAEGEAGVYIVILFILVLRTTATSLITSATAVVLCCLLCCAAALSVAVRNNHSVQCLVLRYAREDNLHRANIPQYTD
jgi:hypothetical protein